VAKADRGTKRQCLSCATKFYDLNRDPILCPSCGTQFLLETDINPTKDEVLEDADTDEVEVDGAAAEAGAEVISLDDAEDDEDDVIDNLPDVDLEDDDEPISTDDDDTFLEDDDDDDQIGFDVPVDKEDD
jgi:uncharacterized protein (TIGR02300 family)